MNDCNIANEILRQYLLLQDASLKNREHEDNLEDNLRDVFQRDYARILYSSSFRRLQGKMQILGVNPTAFYRNRLTHSLEVSQIACSIAYTLNKKYLEKIGKSIYKEDLFVLQAAALAHDIGHPAFGHSGERVLNSVDKNLHFEGNAQNFRVLRSLEKRYPDFNGLNLTYRTLLAINKYIVNESEDSVKKFMYKEDYEKLNEIRKLIGLKNQRTLDAQIIDIADEIAYAAHDLEDALAQRYFNIDELMFELDTANEKNLFQDIIENTKQEVATVSKMQGRNNLQGYSQTFRKQLTSKLTDSFVKCITMEEVTSNFAKEHGIDKNNCELSLGKYTDLCHDLSKKIFKCVTRDYDITLYEKRGEIVIRELFSLLSNPKKNAKGLLLPPDYRPIHDVNNEENVFNNELIQNSINYIAGMMDTFAIEEYERLFNKKFETININDYPSRKMSRKTLIQIMISITKKMR